MVIRRFYGPGAGAHGPGVFGLLFFLVLVGLLVVTVIRLVQVSRFRRQPGWGPRGRGARGAWGGPGGNLGGGWPGDPALRELRLRYARGDITRGEFLERGRVLGVPGQQIGHDRPSPNAP